MVPSVNTGQVGAAAALHMHLREIFCDGEPTLSNLALNTGNKIAFLIRTVKLTTWGMMLSLVVMAALLSC